MKKIVFILPAISILYFSCTKNSSSTQPPPRDTLPTPPPPPPKDTFTSGWEKISLSYSSVLNDIFFINNTGFAIGGSTILKSSDGGSSWAQLTVPFGVNSLFNMGMGNEKNAIFVDAQGQLVSTRDGGMSFAISTLPDNIADVFFVDSTTAYAAGTSIWKTTDAANNWVKLFSFTNGGYTSSSLYFLNAQIGWAFGDYGLYKTVNAGVDWQLIPTQFSSRNMAVFFVNSDTGYISHLSYGRFYSQRTLDGGVSWTTIFAGNGYGYPDIHFVSGKTGYITDNTRIYKTQDGGNSWTSEVILVSNTLIELHFIDPNHGWACGGNGTILKFSR